MNKVDVLNLLILGYKYIIGAILLFYFIFESRWIVFIFSKTGLREYRIFLFKKSALKYAKSKGLPDCKDIGVFLRLKTDDKDIIIIQMHIF
jgi:hypothetical protein